MEKPRVRISVRNLVEFILRSGDLDNSSGTSGDKEAMLKGGRLHRKIQRSMKGDYQAEVSLKKESEYDDVVIQVEGRADGIFTEDGAVYIDEIKGTYGNVQAMDMPIPVHRAQAMCYGLIWGEKERISEIHIQMTYAHLETEETRRFREDFSIEELKGWYQKLLDAYHKWIAYSLNWKKERNASMKDLQFPFPYREGQRDIVSGVYHTVSSGKTLFVQAPTGVGKTMSAIFPSVRAIGEGKGETLFYLTAKTITGTVAQEAFHILREKGLKFKVTAITAKEKLCFQDTPECTPEKCPYAKGHFDRVNDAVYELWTTEEVYSREVIRAHAEKWQVCPFEMCLDLSIWVDGIICDYNYVFDPNVHLKRFFGENISGDHIFLIDEAHNLVERGREMYSAGISRQSLVALRKKIRKRFSKLARTLDKANRQMMELEENLAETGKGYQVLSNPGVLPITFLTISGELEEILEEKELEEELRREILEFYFIVRDFLNVSELVDENYVVYTENSAEEGFRLRLFCVNPAENLGEYLKKGKSAIFFSATMFPMLYYRELLTTDRDAYGIYVQSPFPKENRRILIGSDVSSRYTRRNRAEYQKIAGYIARCVWQRQGNYMVFFPSYRLMEDVLQVYEEEFSVDWVRCVCQTPDMTEQEREGFLEEFQEREGTLVGFCVLGGIFSEGVDLTGESLIGAVIVGTGLPQIGSQREILKEYYDKKNHCGFDYAYRYPGMNKVLQAAGRVIRTKEDKGVILLLDDRFWDRDYQEIFPREWQDRTGCRLDTVEGAVETFWKRFT
ncbi:MAG: ATP-dependent DNA helicase [Blautia massiliensis]|uniref:ATP-dependent DNA helicase n=1 Tax=Blautia TaxID=572511 RepID=UPI002430CEA0|nr:ATP-dependent DNA helicase [Blautia massiliensis (ex Durand et al. 2017)]MCI7602679.1 ATP-dependent DNA helicase [Blautia massiliensis (ex Durand et al. 2017)]